MTNMHDLYIPPWLRGNNTVPRNLSLNRFTRPVGKVSIVEL
jgi:hypothetical protein